MELELELTINMAAALLVTFGLTELVKQSLMRFWNESLTHKFSPLIVLVSASIATMLLLDVTTADKQEAILTVLALTFITMGIWSGFKNLGEGVMEAKQTASEE